MSGSRSGSASATDDLAREHLWARLNRAVAAAGEPPGAPLLVVDLDAFDANARDLEARAGGTPIRLASKSIRVPDLLRRALRAPGFSGILAYTLPEALWLCEQGISTDLVVGYPSVDRSAIARLSEDPAAARAITVMVDDPAQLDLLDAARTDRHQVLRIALDVDAGLRVAGQHVGPKRSPLHEAEAVLRLASEVARRPALRLVGVMTYEGQVAGVPDRVPGARGRSAAVHRIKQLSVRQLGRRRAEVREALASFDLEFWNAGGSGSLETSSADSAVTEVSAGSGLLVPGLFDHYRSFTPRPAAFYGVSVVRRPSEEVATLAGGGYAASGAAGPDRLPQPWAPPGLRLTALEGAGEVQTPVVGHRAAMLEIGDLVWLRHAKSGELFEHGATVRLLRGDRFEDEVPTYRGCGCAFG